MCNLIERPLYEFLGFASPIILTIFFCRININVKANYAQKLFHTSFSSKNVKYNYFESIPGADVKHRPAVQFCAT